MLVLLDCGSNGEAVSDTVLRKTHGLYKLLAFQ